ncbi:MAG TPA: MFS transporter [bacterium]|nr:MFS transporter [bacterium]
MRETTLESPRTPERDPAYGWVVVAALSVTEIISWGIAYYSFPVVLQAVERDLGASRAAVTGAFSTALAASALAAIPVGRWLDRYGPRALMTAGSCLAAVLLLAWSRIQTLGELYIVWGGMGLAMATVLYEPAFAAIVQWFPYRRDRALLVLTLAGGLASTIFLPITAHLLERFGWRTTVAVLAAFLAATTIPIHALALRPAPATPPSKDDLPTAAVGGMPLSAALRTAIFWILAVAFAASTFVAATVSVHAIPYLTSQGYSPTYAAAAVGWMGAMQLPGRLLFVPIASWLGAGTATASIFLAQGAGMALLAMVARLPSVIPVIVLLGAANGMSTLARATAVAEVFGRRYYGSVNGAIGLWANGARAVGPVGASLLWVWLGGYEPVFWLLGSAVAIAGLVVWLTPYTAR